MKIPSGSSAAFAVICFVFAADPCSAADDKEPKTPPLAVVHTWGDLVAQKPVMVQPFAQAGQPAAAPAPVPCKLGISGTTAERCGGVVLYCLMEGDSKGTATFASQALGPFMINIQEPSDNPAISQQRVGLIDYARRVDATQLFMQTVPFSSTGDYHIEVRELMDDAKSVFKPVAETVVKVQEKQGTPWSPWGEPDKEPADNSGSVEDYSLMVVANPAGGVAVPKWEGYEPIGFEKTPDGKLPLPQIIPADADPGIQLSVKSSLLTVKLADDEISTYYPDDHFLTRWWVNGKPVQLKLDAPDRKWSRAIGAADVRVKEIRFQMEFHPDRLGVKKGDKVGVQLLFCLRGWEYSGKQAMVEQAMAQMQEEDAPEPWRISRMSNKVEFVYSGNPASAAQSVAP